ncbi:hypothetical protein [Bradyrhizobium sp. SZCCHNR3118]|uniref:hypothetical protein n=1 Tax=Bradyrhizobium sp. SZCCHNR3118 TaxID=3057468 RepID=UPI002916D3C5|nr:hypothetical protein [Bradyrhizobium sp. SZCCHNR3118]
MFLKQKRWRHPCDKGSPTQRALGAAFRFLMETHTWKRHPEPFSKSDRGRQRREERRFINVNKRFARA